MAHTVAVLQREGYPLFFFCGDFIAAEKVVDDEGKGSRMRQHVSYRCPTCTDQGQTQVGRRLEHDVSPSTTDLDKPVPPPFKVTFPIKFSILHELAIVDLAVVQDCRPIEKKNV